MNKKIAASLMSGIMLISGCAGMTVGKPIDRASVSQIQKGKTTKQEAIAIFGEPTSASTDQNGNERIGYTYMRTKGKTSPAIYIPIIGIFIWLLGGGRTKGESKTQSLNLLIKNDVVIDFSYGESANSADMSLFH